MVMLAELKCWRWLPGMLTEDGWRLDCPSDGEWEATSSLAHRSYHKPASGPRLTDPATQGAIVFGILAPLGWAMALARIQQGETLFMHRQHGFTEWLPLPEAIEAALRLEG